MRHAAVPWRGIFKLPWQELSGPPAPSDLGAMSIWGDPPLPARAGPAGYPRLSVGRSTGARLCSSSVVPPGLIRARLIFRAGSRGDRWLPRPTLDALRGCTVQRCVPARVFGTPAPAHLCCLTQARASKYRRWPLWIGGVAGIGAFVLRQMDAWCRKCIRVLRGSGCLPPAWPFRLLRCVFGVRRAGLAMAANHRQWRCRGDSRLPLGRMPVSDASTRGRTDARRFPPGYALALHALGRRAEVAQCWPQPSSAHSSPVHVEHSVRARSRGVARAGRGAHEACAGSADGVCELVGAVRRRDLVQSRDREPWRRVSRETAAREAGRPQMPERWLNSPARLGRHVVPLAN